MAITTANEHENAIKDELCQIGNRAGEQHRRDLDFCLTLTIRLRNAERVEATNAERLRIRRELKQEIFGVFERLVAQSAPGELHGIESEVLAALDRIAPEEG